MEVCVEATGRDIAAQVASLFTERLALVDGDSTPLVVTMFKGVQRDLAGFLKGGRVEMQLGNAQAGGQMVSAGAAAIAAELDALARQWQRDGQGDHLLAAVRSIESWHAVLGERTTVELQCVTGGSIQVQVKGQPDTKIEQGAVLLALTALGVCTRAVRDHLVPGSKLQLVMRAER